MQCGDDFVPSELGRIRRFGVSLSPVDELEIVTNLIVCVAFGLLAGHELFARILDKALPALLTIEEGCSGQENNLLCA